MKWQAAAGRGRPWFGGCVCVCVCVCVFPLRSTSLTAQEGVAGVPVLASPPRPRPRQELPLPEAAPPRAAAGGCEGQRVPRRDTRDCPEWQPRTSLAHWSPFVTDWRASESCLPFISRHLYFSTLPRLANGQGTLCSTRMATRPTPGYVPCHGA
ncbi:uncharacterized protein LOC127008474 [Eriocheir sinensis]|uniref:uncharacterized protein LOC127008474 n=1 Tax=Eriocheir sinensis TaxID=95602 RepID=UPI0021C90205|nr:uncharacterized protein LOC127008474 [Eriocheir sinensis]